MPHAIELTHSLISMDVFHAEGFSTMRRFDSTFDTTDPHEAFKPPVDDADAPAEPETEREGAGDAGDAPDEASVH